MASKTCKHCGNPFDGVKSQVFCSLHCAVWSRITIKKSDECWPWNGATAGGGYGVFGFKAKSMRAIRAVMEVFDERCVLHKCDNPICCNPDHLYAGTYSQNTQDMILRGRRRNQSGENAPRATLTNQQAATIKSLLGQVRQVDLAEKFNVKRCVIADISRGRAYKEA